MKKDQLTVPKGTTRRAIHKTYSYPPIPDLPPIKNLNEALDYIFLLHKAKEYHDKDAKHWKTMFEISKNMEAVMDADLRMKDNIIEALKMGDIPTDTYVELINAIESHKTMNQKLEGEIRQLKRALKKSKKFHHQDFILN